MGYIGVYMKSKNQMNLHQAVTKILQKTEGSWGLIAFDRENPNSIIVSKNHQNFLLGINADSIYIASEVFFVIISKFIYLIFINF